MFKSSSNLLKQATQLGPLRLTVLGNPSRSISTSTIRLADHAESKDDSKPSRLEKLLLDIPPEMKIPVMNERESHSNKRQFSKTSPPSASSSQASRPPRRSPSTPADTYAFLQNMRLPSQPNKSARANDFSKRQNADRQERGPRTEERRPRTENARRQERSAQGEGRHSGGREHREPRQNGRDGARAQSSQGTRNERSPRTDAGHATSPRPAAQPRQQKPEHAPQAAPTVRELFGESSMLGGQSNIGNEVFESLETTAEVPSSKDVPKASNLDLLPPSPIVPHSLAPTAPRKQINEFAVLQADYVLSRNSNVSLDQRGQAIGMVKQRLGA